MKKRLILLSLFMTTFLSTMYSSNDWFEKGAVWYYTTPYSIIGFETCTKVEVLGDTIIKGLPCRKLSFINCATGKTISFEYMHSVNDSVQYYNSKQDHFYLLYDFSAKLGDTIQVHSRKFKPTDGFLNPYSDSIYSFNYVLIGIDSIQLNSKWLTRQKVKPLNTLDWKWWDNYILERVGSLCYFFGRYAVVNNLETVGMLRCYTDSEIHFKNPEWSGDCSNGTSLSELHKTLLQININPSSVSLQIDQTDGSFMKYIEVYTLDGCLLNRVEVNSRIFLLNLCNYKKGVYFLKVFINNSQTVSYKLIKK